eukprot:g9251.t1
MSLSACVSSTLVYKPQNLTASRKYAGIVSTFSRCSIETADFYFLLHTRTQPQLHPSLQHVIETNGYSQQYLLDHPEFIYNNGGVSLNVQWPVNGARASRAEMPINIGVEVNTALDAEPTLKTCYEITEVGYGHLKRAIRTNCYNLSAAIPALKFPNRTGIFILRIWATINPYAKNAQDGWRISNTNLVIIDKLRSEFYEDSIFSINDRFPGFPFDTWADNSALTKVLRDNLIKSNEQVLNRHLKNPGNGMLLKRGFHQWNKPIPRVLHQIWWQGMDDLIEKSKNVYGDDMYNQPDWRRTNFLKWSKTWKKYHPDWNYRFWDEPKILKMVEEHFPEFVTKFNSFDALIKKIDFARYLIMFLYGGLYVDMDFEAFRPIDPLIYSFSGINNNGERYDSRYAGPSVLLSEEGSTKTINCAVLASAPRHPFYWLVIHEVLRREDEYNDKNVSLGVLHSTGPVMLTNVATLYQSLYPQSNIRILKHELDEIELLYPFTADQLEVSFREEKSYECTKLNNCAAKYPHSFAMHHFSGSWWPNHEKEVERRRKK